MSEKRWKILLAVNVGVVLLLIGFAVGIVATTVYSTGPVQCPTDATFCESVNVWRRSDAADMSQPNAHNKRSSSYIEA